MLLRGLTYLLLGGFIGGFVGWVGLVFPETLAESGIQGAPSRLLNEHLLSVFAGLLVVRFVLQRSVGDGWSPLLTLPVRRTTLARAMLANAAVSLLNLLPLAAVAALATSTIAPAATTAGATVWTIGALLMVAATHVATVGLRAAWAMRRWGILAGAGAGIIGVIAGDILGVGLVRAASAWLFGGLQEAALFPTVVLVIAAVGLTLASTAVLCRWTYDWVEGGTAPASRSGPRFTVRGRDPLSSLVLLEVKLILRNRGPREQILAGIGGIVFLVAMLAEGEDRLAMSTYVTAPLLGQFLTVGYGQFAFAWHGGHFDGLLAHVSPRRLVQATLLVMIGLAVGPALIALPVVVWADPFLAVPIAAFALYNAGITAPVMTWTSVRWNRRWVNPEQSRFSTFGGGPVRGLVLFPLLWALPLATSLWWDLPVVLGSVALLGLASLATFRFWFPRLETAFRQRRHALLRCFRGEWISPREWHW
jgi:hypothetical protein